MDYLKEMKEYNYNHTHDQAEEHENYVNKINQVASREDIDDNQRKIILEIIDFLAE